MIKVGDKITSVVEGRLVFGVVCPSRFHESGFDWESCHDGELRFDQYESEDVEWIPGHYDEHSHKGMTLLAAQAL